MHIAHRVNRLYTRLTDFKTRLAIKKKWAQDSKRLPLTAAHWELYEIIHRLCLKELGEFPNLVNCRDFNDRIQWLKLFDQDFEIIRCSDKILVRDYVRERVGEKYLVELYQVHDHFDEIDFEALPKSFVIKTNHDSGTVILVRDKTKLDRNSAKQKIKQSLKQAYGWANGEWAYSYVESKVLVEEYINAHSTTPPPDYKFYCIEGKVKFCHYIYDRGFSTKEQTIDPKGNDLKIELYPSFIYGNAFTKPLEWESMISLAEKVGKGFKCVRVDMFLFGKNVYIGEMTFWPMAGHYRGDGQKLLGKLLDFDRTTFKPFLIQSLEKTKSRFDIFTNA
ncbi:ATP-grasp fold amidoligase family protein [Rhodoferax sp.]|uniref:ATP-grasp fold amidoligase family protein n=1 Tax=Rhodoferax sp. TaxID=50421 RepID=UPI0026182EE2|nr:ATP-grasp fold amidoligase family protein [Rhodoferax sp.]MDD3936006.1 ATP-grasp fold amidoligase family protein [Rhodoferax sp.]